MAEVDTGADKGTKADPIIDWFGFGGEPEFLPPLPGKKDDPCAGGRCELSPGKDGGERPSGGGQTFYGVEAESVSLYRKGQGSRKAGGETAVNPPGGGGGGRDVVAPPDVVAKPGLKDNPTFTGEQAAEALKYAKDNKLPVIVYMGADWCPGCQQLKPQVEAKMAQMGGRAVLIEVNADHGIPAELRQSLAGTRSIPAAWVGQATDGGFQGTKMGNASQVLSQMEQIRTSTPAPVRDQVTPPGPNPRRDVLPPPPGPVKGPVEKDKTPTGGDKPLDPNAPEVFEGGDVAAALKYAAEHNLPVFLRESATWCGPCNAMKPMWEKNQAELKGKAVFIHVDADAYGNGQYGQDAMKLLQPIINGNTRVPAVWSGTASLDAAGNPVANLKKLGNAWQVTPMLDRLRSAR